MKTFCFAKIRISVYLEGTIAIGLFCVFFRWLFHLYSDVLRLSSANDAIPEHLVRYIAQRVACKFPNGKYCASSTRAKVLRERVGYEWYEFVGGEGRGNRRSAYTHDADTRVCFLVIRSVACSDNAAGRQQYFIVSHLLACLGLFLSAPISPAFAFTLRSPPTCVYRRYFSIGDAIGDAIRRFYCYYVLLKPDLDFTYSIKSRGINWRN